MSKIIVTNPVVEIDGDEMTNHMEIYQGTANLTVY